MFQCYGNYHKYRLYDNNHKYGNTNNTENTGTKKIPKADINISNTANPTLS
jgi:hypothetical protein